MYSMCSRALQENAEKFGIQQIETIEFASAMDEIDPLKTFRRKFHFPKMGVSGLESDVINGSISDDYVYLCGHSLGLQPKKTESYVEQVLKDWKNFGSESHFYGFLPFANSETHLKKSMGKLFGCSPKDVTATNGLTVNLHLMMSYFYKPTTKRHKILMEENAFSSDLYVAQSHLVKNGYDLETSLILAKPRKNEYALRIEDILRLLEQYGEEIAVVLWPGVQYYTGQRFQLKSIIDTAREKGCVIGLDLAHSVGNVPVELDKWNPDFAVWCCYKYLNGGPGGFGGLYVNKKYTHDGSDPRFLKGWWGNDLKTRFNFNKDFDPAEGSDRFKLSNQSPILSAMLLSSLEIFEQVNHSALQEKQYLLTGYMEHLLKLKLPEITIITPSDPKQRGSQLSLLLAEKTITVHRNLLKLGVMCDERADVLRVTPIPLYNSFSDVLKFVETLTKVLKNLSLNAR